VDSNASKLGDSLEVIVRLSRFATVVDELWSLTGDGRWHSTRTLVRESSFGPEAVNAALDFLVKYGFVQSSGDVEMRVRLAGGPSPSEVVRVLSALAFQKAPRFMYA
jgi:hypothetical protein